MRPPAKPDNVLLGALGVVLVVVTLWLAALLAVGCGRGGAGGNGCTYPRSGVVEPATSDASGPGGKVCEVRR